MKKMKQILAIIGVILLVGMYACTLIFALIGSPASMALLRASIAATVIIPVLLYAYILIARLVKGKQDDPTSNNSSSKDDK